MRLAAFWTPKEMHCKPRQCRIFKLILVRNDVIVRADQHAEAAARLARPGDPGYFIGFPRPIAVPA